MMVQQEDLFKYFIEQRASLESEKHFVIYAGLII